ncbi:hypothetical protein SDJN02_09927, partial [Cucurbita argyrosperma subsp. argyrosperma]
MQFLAIDVEEAELKLVCFKRLKSCCPFVYKTRHPVNRGDCRWRFFGLIFSCLHKGKLSFADTGCMCCAVLQAFIFCFPYLKNRALSFSVEPHSLDEVDVNVLVRARSIVFEVTGHRALVLNLTAWTRNRALSFSVEPHSLDEVDVNVLVRAQYIVSEVTEHRALVLNLTAWMRNRAPSFSVEPRSLDEVDVNVLVRAQSIVSEVIEHRALVLNLTT